MYVVELSVLSWFWIMTEWKEVKGHNTSYMHSSCNGRFHSAEALSCMRPTAVPTPMMTKEKHAAGCRQTNNCTFVRTEQIERSYPTRDVHCHPLQCFHPCPPNTMHDPAHQRNDYSHWDVPGRSDSTRRQNMGCPTNTQTCECNRPTEPAGLTEPDFSAVAVPPFGKGRIVYMDCRKI
jgi:hypothetical protein